MSRLKICGFTCETEIDMVAEFAVSLVGLWHGTGGRHELCQPRLARLAERASRAGIEPCMVTLSHDPAMIACALAESNVRVLQLHGFCLPPQISAIRDAVAARGHDIEILKVLHVTGPRCLEERLVRAYASSGVDGFIVDAFGGRDAVGSTGARVALDVARRLCEAPVPVMLAGGIDPALMDTLDVSDRFAGFDIDSGARNLGGFCRDRIAALVAAHSRLKDVQRHAA